MVAALAVFASWRYVLSPTISRHAELKEEVASQRDLLSTELALLENQDQFTGLYALADSSLRSVTPRLFTIQDNELATIALGQYVESVARSSSVLITQNTTRPALQRDDGLRGLQIDIRGESDLEGILKMLDRLESGVKIVQVTTMNMRPGQSESGIDSNEDVLTFDASIVGFGVDTAVVRGDASPPPPPTTRRRAEQ
jgi:hypothetical protein